MFELLKVDLKRIWKDKLFLVICILAGAFAVCSPLLYKGLTFFMEKGEGFPLPVDAKSLFFNAFSPGNNVGLILPILLLIILCKDFGHGTIRNKVICGKSRAQIFFSMLLACAVYTCGIMLLYALLSLGVSLIFFDYQATAFTAKDFWYLLASVGMEMLVYLFITALVCLLAVTMRNAGVAIVVYVAISFFFAIIGSVTSMGVLMVDQGNKVAYKFLEIFNKCNLFLGGVIGMGNSYTVSDIVCVIATALFGGAGFTLLGCWLFKRKDLK